jgi:hypothetical protein
MVDGPEKLFPEPLHGPNGGLRSKPPSKAYDEGWERTFGKKRKPRGRKPRKRKSR